MSLKAKFKYLWNIRISKEKEYYINIHCDIIIIAKIGMIQKGNTPK